MDTLAGKGAEFAVHINDVKHKVIPVIDDAFAKSISRHETLDELKESLKQQMQLRAFQQAEEAYHQSLINQAVANSEVDIPQEMVDQRIDEIEQEVKLNMEAQGMDFDKYLPTWASRRKNSARATIRLLNSRYAKAWCLRKSPMLKNWKRQIRI